MTNIKNKVHGCDPVHYFHAILAHLLLEGLLESHSYLRAKQVFKERFKTVFHGVESKLLK